MYSISNHISIVTLVSFSIRFYPLSGHLAYTLCVRLSTIVNPLACMLVLFQPRIMRMTGLSVLSAVATVFAAYLLALAALSPNPPLQDHAFGVLLVVGMLGI